MTAVVKVVGDVAGTGVHDGRYVVSWDADVPFGTVAVTSTPDIREAKRFANKAAAMEELAAVSRVEPVRPTDGMPNRPLTALHLLIEDV